MGIMAVVQQILVMLLVAGVGLLLRRRRLLTDAGMAQVNLIVLRVALPAMILMMTQRDYSPEAKGQFLQVLGAGFAAMAAGGMLLWLLTARRPQVRRRAVLTGLAAMPNAGYMGLPLVTALYGAEGALLLAAYIMAFNLLLFSLFQWQFAGNWQHLKQLWTNLGLMACVVAMALFMLDIRLPPAAGSLFNQLGNLTTPLAMMLAGARMNDFQLKDLADPPLWAALGMRLLGLPLATFLVMRALGLSGLALGVLVLATAMPSAVTAVVYAEQYHKDTTLAATGVTLSTVLCLATIPLVLWLTGV